MRDQSLRLFVFVFYQTEDGRTRIQCRFEAERADSNLLLRVGYKLQHVAVDAVALVGGRGAVIEDVAEMDAGAGAAYFDAHHAERASSCRLMAPATGLEKLGQPVPLSNLLVLRKSGVPVMGSTKVPGRFSSRCDPVPARVLVGTGSTGSS